MTFLCIVSPTPSVWHQWNNRNGKLLCFCPQMYIIWASFEHFLQLNVQNIRCWEATMKKHVFPTLPFLISSLGVSMATKSLSAGSLSADALTSIKSLFLPLFLSLSVCEPTSTRVTSAALLTCNLTQRWFIQTSCSNFILLRKRQQKQNNN